MRAADALQLLEMIDCGYHKVSAAHTWVLEHMSPPSRALMSPGDEVRAWATVRSWVGKVEHRIRTALRTGTGPERRRRKVLVGMFSLIEFRSARPEVEALFKASVGETPLQEFMRLCGPRMPHFYYRWAFDALPVRQRAFGPKSLKPFEASPDHRRVFRALEDEKRDLLQVRKVMES